LSEACSNGDILTNNFTEFVGLKNYIRVFNTPAFYQSVRNSFVYFFLQIPIAILGGMFVANILNKPILFRAAYRAIYFLPIAIGSVILAIVWRWMFQTNGGILNFFLDSLGLPPVGWLTDQKASMISISLMKAWMDIGYYTIVFLGAYQSISSDLIEAAHIDGANSMQIFWKVKLPLLNPTIVFCIMMATIWCFQIFNEPYIMSEGGPLGSSMTMTLYLYQMAFIKHKMSYASAVGVIIAVMVMGISLLERKFFERDVY
jgi:multiple sugar transport system permease protein